MPSIQHIVLLKFKSSVDEEGKAKTFDIAKGYLRRIPQAKDFVIGPPLSSRLSRGYDYGMIVTFDNAEALGQYIQHPEHSALMKALKPFTEGMVVYQIEVPGVSSKL